MAATIKESVAGLQGDNPAGWYLYHFSGGTQRLAANKSAVVAICDVLRNGKHELQRWEAAYILGSADTRFAAETLYDAFQNPRETPLVRGAAAEQLTCFKEMIGRRKLIAAYVSGLEDPSPIVRFWCVYGLSQLNAKSHRAKLQSLAATDHEECPGWSKVSTEAKWALACFDNLALQDRLWPGPFRKPPPLANPSRTAFLRRAVELARYVRDYSGQPFGAIVTRGKEIIAEGVNRVVHLNDPTAHAEVAAIREACRILQTFDLSGCEIFCSTEPNMMCLGAIYWARLSRIYYAAPSSDITQRAIPTRNLHRRAGRAPFEAWNKSAGKIRY